MTSMISFIIPLYNRPDEIRELLQSMTRLERKTNGLTFEVIVVEDGSTIPSRDIVSSFVGVLPIRYVTQENGGPGNARNAGATHALGEWLIFLDSDTILPSSYLLELEASMNANPSDLWGGPDKAADDFTIVQKAINYSMTSFFTTGGIRGGDKSVDTFYPRTFNMGVRKEAFEAVNGFRPGMRYGEDLDFSMRVLEKGYKSALYTGVWVYHRRRATFEQFFKQVRHSGEARIELNRLHPGTLKAVHFMPAAFVVFTFLSILGIYWGGFLPHLLYALLIIFDVYGKEGNIELAFYSVAAAYIQLTGYGVGFLSALLSGKTK